MAEALRMEGVENEEIEGEEGGGGTQQALEALEFLTQDADPSGTILVDIRNGFNELSHLAMFLDCATPLAGRGNFCVVFLQALGAT